MESGIKIWDVYRPEQLTTKVWNFVFFGGELPKDSGIPEEGLLYENPALLNQIDSIPSQTHEERVFVLVPPGSASVRKRSCP